MKVTRADVARVAGVSQVTVWRVLIGSAHVRPATRRQVEEAIQRLGYRPHGVARSLARGKSMAVGVVMPNLFNPANVEIVAGAEEVAVEAGYSLLLISTYEDPAREAAAYLQLTERRVDGILLWTRSPSPELQGLVATGPPVVSWGTRLSGERVGVVTGDRRGGATQMARHLIGLGYRRIALLGGPPDFEPALQQREAFAQCLAERGLDLPADWVVTAGAQLEDGRRAARELLAREPLPDAIFAFNDVVAAGALMACREIGLRVPHNMAVVGFDDTVIAELVEPPLTTVRIPLRRIGVTAMEMLLSFMRGEEPDSRMVTLPASLVIRESCGAGGKRKE